MSIPLVSICIPTYNGEEFLEEALKSIEQQTYKNIEVIVSDDNSNDTTLFICQQFKNRVNFPVHIYSHNQTNIGANWDYSIKHSKGDYIKFLFQDDLLNPKCIEIMMSYLEKNKLEIVFCKREIIDEKGKLSTSDFLIRFGDLQKGINLTTHDFYLFNKSDLHLLGSVKQNSLQYNFLGEPVTSLFSRKLYDQIGNFESSLKQFLDLEYWLRVLNKFPIGIISEKLISFRVHDKQASNVNFNNKVNEVNYIERLIIKNFFFYLSFTQQKKIVKKILKIFLSRT